MAYGVPELRGGASGHRETAGTAEQAVGELARIPVGERAFGTVPSAGAFGVALERARLGHGRRTAAEVTARLEAAQRADRTADLGSGLIGATTGAARGSGPPVDPHFTPGSILQGMGG